MEKRMVLFVLVAFGILFASTFIQRKELGKRPQLVGTPAPSAFTEGKTVKKEIAPGAQQDTGTASKKINNRRVFGRELAVENSSIKVRIDESSGNLKRLTLMKFTDHKGPVELCVENPEAGFLELQGPEQLSFRASGIEEGKDQKRLVLETKEGSTGAIVKKEFVFPTEGYLFGMTVVFENPKDSPMDIAASQVRIGPGLGAYTEDDSKRKPLTASVLVGGKVYRNRWGTSFLKNIGRFVGVITGPEPTFVESTYEGKPEFAALSSNYFTLALVPEFLTTGTRVTTRPGNAIELSVMLPAFKLQGKARQEFPFKVYGGPLQYNLLKSLHYSLERIMDLGMFSPLAIAMLYTLQFLYRISGNYGLAIILLTIIIKILLWWPTQKSYQSMKKMQKIQPHITALKQKHQNDAKKLNEETMKLFQEHKVNPMGGCLPMVIQMPVFFALYLSLSSAIELRGAPFYWWINDLSLKDPYYILPILMGISMLYQQKISTPDPAQFKSMLWVPLIFMFTFLWLPSGVLLYWVVQNLLSIGQQTWINQSTAS